MIRTLTILSSLVTFGACAGDLIAQTNSDCAAQSDHCGGKTASGLLYLDTGNLPRVTDGADRLMLCSTPVSGVCDTEHLTIVFEGGPLTADIDPGIADESGWKVRFTNLSTTWIDPPGTLTLNARLRELDFIFDEHDDQAIELSLE